MQFIPNEEKIEKNGELMQIPVKILKVTFLPHKTGTDGFFVAKLENKYFFIDNASFKAPTATSTHPNSLSIGKQ